ncbi:polysaccharide lyase family 7 protein [Gayadomonas joobiniege]|uniref:polysaccharide lyase family 7 protein n=1 Tax=Gayadomonas joobiniege TaxID=1234606 RepID=UPI00035D2597|nr:polysaccharide lyase family 7 protein [Gayadomonas joobiniege]
MFLPKISVLVILLALLSGCGSSSTGPAAIKQPEPLPSPSPSPQPGEEALEPASAPYDVQAYQAVIDDAYLQAPTSTKLIAHGDFDGQYNQYFFIPKQGNAWMTFRVSGDHKRSELRQISEWYVNDANYVYQLSGEVKIIDPLAESVDEITFMQIHDVTKNSNAINKPLLRVVWLRERSGIQNNYWAVIKANACLECSEYDKIPLGAYSADEVANIQITVKNSRMSIAFNDQVNPQIDEYDISYWDHLESYFKAGVYNQTDGTATVQFKSLNFLKIPINNN